MKYILIVFAVFSLALTINSCSESKEEGLRLISIDGIEFIKPDLNSIIKLHNMPVKDWKVLVSENGFEVGGEEIMLIYTKTNPKKKMMIQGLSKSADEFSISWTNFDTPDLIMGEIEVELKEFFFESVGEINYFKIQEKDNTYIISLHRDKNKGVETLAIRDFGRVEQTD
jgi:hypothetical protein